MICIYALVTSSSTFSAFLILLRGQIAHLYFPPYNTDQNESSHQKGRPREGPDRARPFLRGRAGAHRHDRELKAAGSTFLALDCPSYPVLDSSFDDTCEFKYWDWLHSKKFLLLCAIASFLCNLVALITALHQPQFSPLLTKATKLFILTIRIIRSAVRPPKA